MSINAPFKVGDIAKSMPKKESEIIIRLRLLVLIRFIVVKQVCYE